jgi:hypothetical protein
VTRLRHVQQVIRQQFDHVEQLAQAPASDRAAFTDALVKLSGEVRSQLKLEHEISRDLVDLQVMQEFRRTVFEVIAEEAPEIARRILERLKERRALRRSIELQPTDLLGGLHAAGSAE